MMKPLYTQILMILTMLQDLSGLRLIKISIPAYKLRGESTFLECQYELQRQHQSNHNVNSDAVKSDTSYREMVSMTDDKSMTDLKSKIYHNTSVHLKQRYYREQGQQQSQSYHYSHSDKGIDAAPRWPTFYQMQQDEREAFLERGRQKAEKDISLRASWQKSKDAAGERLSTSKSARGAEKRSQNGDIAKDDRYSVRSRIDSGDTFDNDDEDHDGDNGSYDNRNQDWHDESDTLYAIKWYKDNEEFYRYVPKANPPKQSYRVDGVRVIEEHSDSTRVLLRGLTINSTGLYRCEVSAEAPNFSSVQGEGRMDIVYLPRDGPHIKGQRFQYQIGETLNLNCTSGKSHPASHLQWFVNDQPVSDTALLIVHNATVHKHGLITSVLGLRLTVDPSHFLNGAMKVKCLASISPVLWKADNESVFQRRPGIIDNREAMLLVRSRASHALSFQFKHIWVSSALAFSLLVHGLAELILMYPAKRLKHRIIN